MRIVYCLYILATFCTFAVTSFADDSVDPFTLTYYQVLNVPENADLPEIRAAYRQRIAEYSTTQTPEGRAWRVAINRAYDGIGDVHSRVLYDFKVPAPPMSSTGGDHYHTDEMLQEITSFISARPKEITGQLLVDLETLLLKRMGNPQFVIHQRQRNVFYKDVERLIDAPVLTGFASEAVRIVCLDLLIKYNDSVGLNLLDKLYLKWETRIRLSRPGDDVGFHMRRRLELIDILEGKYRRYVPTSFMKQQICVGHLIDKHA